MSHKSVLLQEVIQGLDLKRGDIVVDGTLGSAGHSLALWESAKGKIKIIGVDQDKDRVESSREKLEKAGCDAEVVQGNFRDIDQILEKLGVEKINKVLLDLGLNSEQLENSGKGFSFQTEEPLLMSFGDNPPFSAKEIVNEWAEENIADIIFAYGEEKFSRQIAKEIVFSRKKKDIETTKDLVEIIERAVPNWYKHRKIHFATKTFQALRIAVNDELQALKEGLWKSFKRLNGQGRIAVISFHSLEDKIVKEYFKELKRTGEAQVLTKKPIKPTREETVENPRSRSAKLRIIEKN